MKFIVFSTTDIFEEMYEAESKLKETLEDVDSIALLDEIMTGTTELEQMITDFCTKNFQGDK